VYLSECEEDSADGLLDWRIIFEVDGQRSGIIARDTVREASLQDSRRMLEQFVSNAQLAKAVLVLRSVDKLSEESLKSLPLVVSDPPADAAARVFELLTNQNCQKP